MFQAICSRDIHRDQSSNSLARGIMLAMAANRMAAFESEFKKALALEKKIPYNEFLQQLMEILKKHNMMYTQTIQASQMLVHNKNRGGLMLSVHKVHSNAAVIAAVGADRKQLTNAVCIELAPEGEQRDFNVLKNQALVDRSHGLIANINGSERCLSVGCGHTAAFVKLAKAGGKTSQSCLQDERGNVDSGMHGV